MLPAINIWIWIQSYIFFIIYLFYLPFDNDFWAKILPPLNSPQQRTAVLFFKRPRQFVVEPIPPSTSQFAKFVAMDSFGAMNKEPFEGGTGGTVISLVHCIMFGSVYPSVSTFAYVELSFNFEYVWSNVIWHCKLYCVVCTVMKLRNLWRTFSLANCNYRRTGLESGRQTC